MSTRKELTNEPDPAAAPLSAEPSAGTGPDQAAAAEDARPAAAAPEAPLTPAEIAALQSRAAKAEEHWDRLLRTRADLENYKKRSARERQEAVRFANLALMEKLIPTLDSFEKALAAVTHQAGGNLDSLQAGIAMVHEQLRTVLKEAGLQEIDATQQAFDPNLHEAVSQLESAEVPEGHVLQQLRKGYKLHERLIRPATVVVAKPPAA
jgi:molecular chaperone GrpE